MKSFHEYARTHARTRKPRAEKLNKSVVLYEADCLDVIPSLRTSSVKLLWTDPPYGHSNGKGDLLSSVHKVFRGAAKNEQTPILNDDADSMRNVVSAMLSAAVRVLTEDSCCCCCCCGGGGPKPTFAWLANRMDSEGLAFFHSVIWDKVNWGLGLRYRRRHEMVMLAHRRGGKLAWNHDEKPVPNIFRMLKPRNGEHPNVKPVELVKQFIRVHTRPGDTVLDPFAGSGTTAIAAMELGRKCILIELDPSYAQVIRDRVRAVSKPRPA